MYYPHLRMKPLSALKISILFLLFFAPDYSTANVHWQYFYPQNQERVQTEFSNKQKPEKERAYHKKKKSRKRLLLKRFEDKLPLLPKIKTAFILALVGFFGSLLIGIFAAPLFIISIVKANKGLKELKAEYKYFKEQAHRGKGMAIASIVISALGLAIMILAIFIIALVLLTL